MVLPDVSRTKSPAYLSLSTESFSPSSRRLHTPMLFPRDFLAAFHKGDIPINISREIEATYFVPRTETIPLLRANSVDRAHISQAYFTKEIRDELVQQLLWASRSLALSEVLEEVKSARVRRIDKDGHVTLCLDLKGAKQGPEDARIARTEISIALDTKTYRRLRENALRGGIEKTRYFIDGVVEPRGGDSIDVRAEIDHFERIGAFKNGRPKDVVSNALDFSLVDIELPNRGLLRTLRAGNHSFDFLGNALDVALLPTELQKQFSAQRLASQGITEDILWAIKKVARKLEKAAS